jgi:NADH dehydrogenase
LAELARYTLSGDFRRISAGEARILLLEADGRILPGYPESLARYATASLNRLGVELRVNTRVVDVDEQGVTVTTPDGEERIEARTLLWAAGVRGTEAGNALVEECGMPPAPAGRIAVTPQLTVPGHPDIFVIGDLAFVEQDGRPLPAVAPVAMQQGAYVADVIRRRLAGEAAPPFRYRDRGSMATIGRASAVADLGRVKLQGFAGWVAWLLVHLMMLVRFENKVLVLMQWTWSHFTHGRSARLITGRSTTAHRNPSRTGTG